MDVYHFLLLHTSALQIVLAAAGAVAAWRAWHLCGRKTLIAFYLVHSLFLIVGAVSFADAVAFDLPGWYMHAQWMVSRHHLSGKDFMSPYSLGFNATRLADTADGPGICYNTPPKSPERRQTRTTRKEAEP